MELQFQKSTISCLQPLKSQVLNQEQTVEVRLDDSKPEIGRVMGAWGQVVLRGKEWRSDCVQVSGGVMAWVLYLPEDGAACCCVEAWLPMQWKMDIPPSQRDGTVIANALLRSVDARSLTTKKMMVRANVQLQLQVVAPDQVQLSQAEEVPPDVQLLKKQQTVLLPAEAGEKAFVIDELLRLPGDCVPMEKRMYMHLQPEVSDRKVMTDKVVFRGTGILHMLYLGQDKRLHTWDFELPFAQYGELTGQYSEEAQVRMLPAVTSLEITDNQDGSMQLSAGVIGQYVVYEKCSPEYIADAYSTTRTVQPRFERVQLPVILDMDTQSVSCRALQPDAEQVVETVFLPEQPGQVRTDTGVSIELAGQFQTLYYTADGSLEVANSNWDWQSAVDLEEDCAVETGAAVCGTVKIGREGGTVSLQTDILVDTICFSNQGLLAVDMLEMSDEEKPDVDRPSLILRRAGKASLWEMAKATGSTVEAIKATNNLTEEPAAESMLIIPIG